MAARVEVNISLAFLHWAGIALLLWPFVSYIAIFVLKGDVKLQLINLSVCLSLHISKTIAGHGSIILWEQYNTFHASSFVDDIMFSYNGVNRPESCMFHPVFQVAAPWTQSTVSYCILLLLLLRNIWHCESSNHCFLLCAGNTSENSVTGFQGLPC